MSEPRREIDTETADPLSEAQNTTHEQPVNTEPLEGVAIAKDSNGEKQLDADYVEEKEEKEDSSESEFSVLKNKSRLPLDRSTTQQTVSSVSTRDLEYVDSHSAPVKRSKWERYFLFKSTHPPPVPKERGVSPEFSAGFFSQMVFHWMGPIMTTGYNRTLEQNDLWQVNPKRSSAVMSDKLSAAFKKRVARKDKRPLLGALYETFKFDFLLAAGCQLVAAVVQTINPFVLRYIISFAAQAYIAQSEGLPGPHVGRGIGLVFCVTILQLIQSLCTSQYLYRGMLNGGQARAALVSVIFDKSLTISGRAKAGSSTLKDMTEARPADATPGSKAEKAWFARMLKKDKVNAKANPQKGISGDGAGYSNGRIVNLMSVDTARIDLASGMFHWIWASPVVLILTLILLLINITYSALAGFGLILLTTPLLGKAIKSLFIRRRAINKITDQRVSLTQEILHAVRFVKYFGWETSFLERLGTIRRKEIRGIQWLMVIRNGINAISMSVPVFASMLAFITYSLTKHNLNPAYIFSSLALFNSMRLPLNLLPLVIGQVTDAASSVARIQEFLLADDEEDQANWNYDNKNAIDMREGNFTWERARSNEENKDAAKSSKQRKADEKAAKATEKLSKDQKAGKQPKTHDTSEKLKNDSTSTLEEEKTPFSINDLSFSIARNELVAVIGGVGSGKSSLLAALAGDMRKTSGSLDLGASRAFCPQYAWIQNATVKENILFGKDMDTEWYNNVIDACALRADLDMLPAGDYTEIGERGITVSGGQKQRLNIARAIYFDADIVLMDDPLSAVDAHVGRHIMDNAICGLLKDKCRVLATHQLWVLNRCDRIIWMDEGRIRTVGTFDGLMNEDPEFVKLIANNAQEEKQTKKPDDEDEVEDEQKDQNRRKAKKGAALMQAEERAVSSVPWSVYKAYIKASGGMYVLPLAAVLLVLAQGAQITTNLWLSWWTSNKFGLSTGAYIGAYAALGFIQALLMFLFSIVLSYYGTESSKVMLHRAITRVLRSPMSFFDTTPLGRITNRFSKDIDVMDNQLTDAMRFFLITIGMIVSVFILIIAYFYYFVIALVPLALAFCFSAGFYRSSAREVKRHEAVLRSHVYSRFSESVNGISTIRAYGLQSRFRESIRTAVDNMDSAYFLTFANQRWLSVRIDIVGVLLVFVLGILVVTSRFTVSPSSGGLVLSYILSIVQMMSFTVRQLAEVENDMNATERVHYYGTQLDEEPPMHLKEVPASWPDKGEIVFDDVQMRYRAGLPLVLKSFNLHVKGGERIGVVGRTGAGKSSIMGTLFRIVELSGGSINIDGININTIGLADLRSRLSIIPQDPTLFRGTIRSNLDPFNKYTDKDLWDALRQADLVGQTVEMDDQSGRIHLDTAVEEEGLNFSLGQRQLMALARALVRGSQIIVCDEATSSVDMETDQRIQEAIRNGFKGKTLLCIAHRLRTIIHYDRIVVMDSGTIAEVDTPLSLFDKGGIFAQMCWKSSIRREDFEAPEGGA